VTSKESDKIFTVHLLKKKTTAPSSGTGPCPFFFATELENNTSLQELIQEGLKVVAPLLQEVEEWAKAEQAKEEEKEKEKEKEPENECSWEKMPPRMWGRCGSGPCHKRFSRPPCWRGNCNAGQAPRCTFDFTGTQYAPHRSWYSCVTCGLVNNEGCCEGCKVTCHAGHELIPRGFSPAFFCDCGAGQNCKLRSSASSSSDASSSSPAPSEEEVSAKEQTDACCAPPSVPEEEPKKEDDCFLPVVEEEEPQQETETTEDQAAEGETKDEEENSFAQKLKQLEAMGFVDRALNIEVLVRHKGEVIPAVTQLLNHY